MKNFLSSPYQVFDSGCYLKNWEKNIPESPTEKQSLASHVRQIWNTLTGQGDAIARDYLNEAAGVRAYLAAYLLPNIERMYSILMRDEYFAHLKIAAEACNDELTVLDLGAGPLSASIALLSALNSLENCPKRIRIFAVERSEKIFSAGLALLEPCLSQRFQVECQRFTSLAGLPTSVDIALAANVVNEVPLPHRLNTMENLFRACNENALVVIMEPGQEHHSRALSTLRNLMVEKGTNKTLSLIGPCLHEKKCPLTSNAVRKDWCWFRTEWNVPIALAAFDVFTKLDHTTLNYCYLVYSGRARTPPHPFARIVSDSIEFPHDKQKREAAQKYIAAHMSAGDAKDIHAVVESGKGAKQLICTDKGTLESSVCNLEEEKPRARGETVTRKKSTLRFKEKA